MIIWKNYACIAGVWYDSEPMEYTSELQMQFEKAQRNYFRGLSEREPELIFL